MTSVGSMVGRHGKPVMRVGLWLAGASLVAMAAGCGQKGPLYLPPAGATVAPPTSTNPATSPAQPPSSAASAPNSALPNPR